MQDTPHLAVIGGSGLYSIPDLKDTHEHDLTTPFGKPSAPVVVGTLEGKRVAFLARHGIGHHISPPEVNYRANIYALKSLGVKAVVSISAVGSLREDYAPVHIVIPDQLFDFARSRKGSFFENGLVVHIGVADPFCTQLSASLLQAVQQTGATVHNGGHLITIEGPRFSTRSESNVYRVWGMSIIGMTTSPEAYLAREAEMCYAVMAHVTDYDVWHVSEKPVSVEMVIRILNQNTATAQQAIRNLVKMLDVEADCACHHALAEALITQHDVIPAETRKRLSLLVDKYL
ncbi:MAG: S-methyl-5'-thioadenosine phosphorylase [Anaerolineales bacterium]|jgi:5'-methylthioadenosine phosphorylase|nr:S-methyl-5'-thioadenosine phosphorylase [Anaerolineales bacterium]